MLIGRFAQNNMDTGEYPVRYFELMKEIAVALRALPAQILTHEYTCEVFGSWFLTFRYGGFPLRLIFDGRDHHLSLHKSDTKKAPYAWGSALWEKDVIVPDSLPLTELMDEIKKTGKLKNKHQSYDLPTED